jgi:hypothetical protein
MAFPGCLGGGVRGPALRHFGNAEVQHPSCSVAGCAYWIIAGSHVVPCKGYWGRVSDSPDPLCHATQG